MHYQKPEIVFVSEAIATIQNPAPQGKIGSPSDGVPMVERLSVNAYDADE